MQHTPAPPDNLIQKLRENDQQTLQLLYVTNYPKIKNYILDNSGSDDDAKDIYQEAFIAVWRNIQLNKIEITGTDKLNGYIFRVAQFKWLDQLRRTKNYKFATLPEADIADYHLSERDPDEDEFIEKVKMNYAKMEEPCKTVLHRFYFLKQSMSEIAATFRWTDATAKNNKYRCLQRLRQLVLPQKK